MEGSASNLEENLRDSNQETTAQAENENNSGFENEKIEDENNGGFENEKMEDESNGGIPNQDLVVQSQKNLTEGQDERQEDITEQKDIDLNQFESQESYRNFEVENALQSVNVSDLAIKENLNPDLNTDDIDEKKESEKELEEDTAKINESSLKGLKSNLIPDGLVQLLEIISKEVLKRQPLNIIEFISFLLADLLAIRTKKRGEPIDLHFSEPALPYNLLPISLGFKMDAESLFSRRGTFY